MFYSIIQKHAAFSGQKRRQAHKQKKRPESRFLYRVINCHAPCPTRPADRRGGTLCAGVRPDSVCC